MADLEKIVAGMSEAQKKKLLDISNGKPREYALGTQGFALMRAKLVFVNELGARHLTDLGHQVRNLLIERK